MKDLTKDIVQEVATGLIHVNDTTTTLEVKKELRDEGFWARQQDVSDYMRELANDSIYTFADNGVYRTYDFVVEGDYDDDDDGAKVVTPILTSVDAEQLDDQEAGCWITFSYSDPATKIFVNGNVPRNVARHFAKTLLNETDYGNVAASKAK